jgi:hypothetical protein
MTLMREHVRIHYGVVVPDSSVINNTEDYFSYTSPNGNVVGWNRNTEVWWRNREHTEPLPKDEFVTGVLCDIPKYLGTISSKE